MDNFEIQKINRTPNHNQDEHIKRGINSSECDGNIGLGLVVRKIKAQNLQSKILFVQVNNEGLWVGDL